MHKAHGQFYNNDNSETQELRKQLEEKKNWQKKKNQLKNC
jgi:hypothetical protein